MNILTLLENDRRMTGWLMMVRAVSMIVRNSCLSGLFSNYKVNTELQVGSCIAKPFNRPIHVSKFFGPF